MSTNTPPTYYSGPLLQWPENDGGKRDLGRPMLIGDAQEICIASKQDTSLSQRMIKQVRVAGTLTPKLCGRYHFHAARSKRADDGIRVFARHVPVQLSSTWPYHGKCTSTYNSESHECGLWNPVDFAPISLANRAVSPTCHFQAIPQRLINIWAISAERCSKNS